VVPQFRDLIVQSGFVKAFHYRNAGSLDALRLRSFEIVPVGRGQPSNNLDDFEVPSFLHVRLASSNECEHDVVFALVTEAR
jgi:hypothetical protein